jgi:hypothetical protein
MVNKLSKPTNKEQEQEQLNCSILFDEVKERIQILRDSGISESRIASLFYCERLLLSLTISKSYRIFLGDNHIEVRMEPLVKAIYLLFLSHPEGIVFKDLPDYRGELTKIYAEVRPWGLSERALQSIEDVTNPLLNSINEKCARIRKAFLNVMDARTAEHYYIKGSRGGVKSISLSRDLVIWE